MPAEQETNHPKQGEPFCDSVEALTDNQGVIAAEKKTSDLIATSSYCKIKQYFQEKDCQES